MRYCTDTRMQAHVNISGKACWELQRKETDIDNTESQAFASDI